ncbi:MAG: lipid A biosynthesis acyltransferase [Tepidisphaeraceae bacterium]|jgi:KDO2-lipid IV(A) lauroyltransferase
MDKRRNDLLDQLIYAAVRLAAMLIHALPVEFCLATGRMLGRVWYRLDARHAARARANLHNCFPDFTPGQCDKIARQSMEHLFMLVVEILFTTRLIHMETWRKYVELGDIEPTLELMLRRKNGRGGLIMLTGHYGNWEITGYTLATLGFETVSVARALNNPYLNNWLMGVRQRRGQRVVDKKGAAMEVAELLQSGGVVAFVADQNAGPKGVFVDFFGRKASTYKSIALLAMQFEVPIVVGYARRMDGGFRFKVDTQDIIRPEDWKEEADPLIYITQRYTKAIEEFVRAAPAQYWWMHRRWKTRPKGETAMPYD